MLCNALICSNRKQSKRDHGSCASAQRCWCSCFSRRSVARSLPARMQRISIAGFWQWVAGEALYVLDTATCYDMQQLLQRWEGIQHWQQQQACKQARNHLLAPSCNCTQL